MLKNPIQPLERNSLGAMQFKANAIVKHLMDSHPSCGWKELHRMQFSDDDRQQFAQLIGYTLSGYGTLRGYVSDEAYSAAENMATGMAEHEARIAALEQKIEELRAARDALREPMARLLEMHPDDLRNT